MPSSHSKLTHITHQFIVHMVLLFPQMPKTYFRMVSVSVLFVPIWSPFSVASTFGPRPLQARCKACENCFLWHHSSDRTSGKGRARIGKAVLEPCWTLSLGSQNIALTPLFQRGFVAQRLVYRSGSAILSPARQAGPRLPCVSLQDTRRRLRAQSPLGCAQAGEEGCLLRPCSTSCLPGIKSRLLNAVYEAP